MKPVHVIEPYFFLLATIIIVMNGCGTSYTVSPSHGKGDYSYSDLNSEFLEKEVMIELHDGRQMQANQIWFEADTVSWTESTSGGHYRIAAGDVTRISRRNHLLGGLEGLGGGLVADAALLAVVSSSPQHEFPVAGFFALLGLPPLAAVLGAVGGHRYEYGFPVDSTNARQR